MPPDSPKIGEYKRYNELFPRIKELPGVIDVVPGSKIDIIVIKPPENQETTTDKYIEAQMELLEAPLEELGVNIHTIGFSCPGWRSPLRKKASTGKCEILSLDQVGIKPLQALQIKTGDIIGDIIPNSIAYLPLYLGIDTLPVMMFHLRRLNVDPHDIQPGNRFGVTTDSKSEYVLEVDKYGRFKVIEGVALLGAEFYCFTEDGRLDVGDGRQSSRIKTMKKL